MAGLNGTAGLCMLDFWALSEGATNDDRGLFLQAQEVSASRR